MLGTIDRGHVLRLLEALARQDGAGLLSEVEHLDERAPDYATVLDELLAALQRIAVLQLVGGRSDDEDYAPLEPLAAQIGAEDAQLYYQIALHGRRDLPICRDPRMGFEMTLLRMLAFRPAGQGEGTRAASAAPSRTEPTAAVAKPASGAPPSRPATPAGSTEPARTARVEVPAGTVDWPALLQTLELRGPARQLADNCDLASSAGGTWQLVLAADKEHLNTQALRTRLETALREHFGREVRFTITPGKTQRPTPADLRKASENERMREARETIESDPNVKAVQAAFEATLEADSIRSTR
jgi:DNA polymerase-3 subunit gamma/tau